MIIFFSFVFGFFVGLVSFYLYYHRQKNVNSPKGIIPKNIYDELKVKHEELQRLLSQKTENLGYLMGELKTLKETSEQQKIVFENLATKIIKHEKEELVNQNRNSLDIILNPFKEKMTELQSKVETFYGSESQQRSALKKEIEMIAQNNKMLSQEANQLSQALRGDTKKQGDWGEMQLEILLQKSGLKKGVGYNKQETFVNHEKEKFRPDFILYLPPGDKQIVIDSKVSLVNYERYCNSQEQADKEKALKDFMENIRHHINDLSNKNYSQLLGINSVDYVIMFMPIEPALSLALENRNSILEYALQKNIILASTITLFPILKTINFLWKQDSQSKNAKLIATKAGEMYDQFVAFVEDLDKVGDNLRKAQESFENSKKRLRDSPKHSTTLIYRSQELKQLGINSKKEFLQ